MRRLALKKRDAGVDRLILVPGGHGVVSPARSAQRSGRCVSCPGKAALKALAEGRDPGGDAIVLI
jgi:hypothetical protein